MKGWLSGRKFSVDVCGWMRPAEMQAKTRRTRQIAIEARRVGTFLTIKLKGNLRRRRVSVRRRLGQQECSGELAQKARRQRILQQLRRPRYSIPAEDALVLKDARGICLLVLVHVASGCDGRRPLIRAGGLVKGPHRRAAALGALPRVLFDA